MLARTVAEQKFIHFYADGLKYNQDDTMKLCHTISAAFKEIAKSLREILRKEKSITVEESILNEDMLKIACSGIPFALSGSAVALLSNLITTKYAIFVRNAQFPWKHECALRMGLGILKKDVLDAVREWLMQEFKYSTKLSTSAGTMLAEGYDIERFRQSVKEKVFIAISGASNEKITDITVHDNQQQQHRTSFQDAPELFEEELKEKSVDGKDVQDELVAVGYDDVDGWEVVSADIYTCVPKI